MPETINNKKVFTLLEVNRSIEKTLSERYTSAFWVRAEMNKLNHYKYSGHCYPDLVEKQGGKVIAQIRANLWKDDYIRTNQLFESTLKEPLKDGIKIMFLARISFSPVYGISLRILEIDPAYTLGDLEREKKETIDRLRLESIFDKNKLFPLPLLPQRIAIISVETSKGYADFLKVIDDNEFGYNFFHLLFPALLQGEKAIDSIGKQLKRIKKVINHFDVVAIIRGGGGDIGLSCYNHYQLAKEIALFPIPVLTGIGHATNETVVEMVANTNNITPTKMADFLLQKFHNFSVPVSDARQKIIDKAQQLLKEEKVKFRSETKLFQMATQHIFSSNKSELDEGIQSFLNHSRFLFRNERMQIDATGTQLGKLSINALNFQAQGVRLLHTNLSSRLKQFVNVRQIELATLEKNVSILSPQNVLKRGYSITRLDGKALSSIDQIKDGDLIETTVHKGKIASRVEGLKK